MAGFPFSFSQIPGNPTFRNSSVNTVAVVPLLSSNKDGEISTTHSARSFDNLFSAVRRQNHQQDNNNNNSSGGEGKYDDKDDDREILVVVPNSSLTRPGDWRYNDTPLKGFHWQHGCQRLRLFDGRPQNTRLAHDRLINHAVSRDWIDLCPSRRTAAVIGVLNLRDCQDVTDLDRAEEELHQWANRYAMPPYECTAHGRNFDRDRPVERLFVFDSFHEDCQGIDLSVSNMGNSILAFPPVEAEHLEMMNLHLKIVINDLAVTIFRSIEKKIKDSDAISRQFVSTAKEESLASTARRNFSRIISGSATSEGSAMSNSEEPVSSSKRLNIRDMAGFVSPESKLGKESPQSGRSTPTASFSSELLAAEDFVEDMGSIQFSNSAPKLITPLDKVWEQSSLSGRDYEAIRKRDAARREKWAADMTLLAGSPLDAYERYLKAAEMCKTGTPDPLWYAFALDGCAAAHIAMAEAGGYGVDEYLEMNFQMPEDVMALAKDEKRQTSGSSSKQTLPEVVFALCEEALNITNRHESLGPIHAELLLKLAWYVSETSESHLRCRWGEGEGCYAGEVDDVPRWQKPSVYKLKFIEARTKDVLRDMVNINSFNRTKQVCELLHEAVSVATIDACTRVDVAARCARLCLDGVKATQWNWNEDGVDERIKLPRKAAFFMVTAAEALSISRSGGSESQARNLWLYASQLYTKNPNPIDHNGDYGWAALRAITLNALSMQGNSPVTLQAAEELLSLLGEITPKIPRQEKAEQKSATPKRARRASSAKGSTEHRPIGASGHGAKSSAPERVTKDPSVIDEAGTVKATPSTFARQLRDSFTTMTGNDNILAIESKWADGDIIRPDDVPFAPTSEGFASTQTMGCVWRNIEFEKCGIAQTHCIDRITKLRRALPTISTLHRETATGVETARLPLYVSSALKIQPEPALELERIVKKVKGEGKESQGAMATFYNPFDNKRSKEKITIVSEGEERAMSVEFTNRLAVPLAIQRCQLEFENEGGGRIKATPIAFTLSPKATGFAVRFPFSVLSSATKAVSDGTIFEVKGISLTLLGRVVFLPFHSTNQDTGEFPKARLDRAKKGNVNQEKVDKPRFETCPCQPRLLVEVTKSSAPVDPEKPVQVSLANGELFSLPSLTLKNYPGPSGNGNMEQLQIFAVDIPGLLDQKLFDSDQDQKVVSEEDFTQQLFREDEKSPALRLRLLSSKLRLDEVNDKDGNGSIVSFQIGAALNMTERFRSGSTIKIRFRYRGAGTPSNQFWRKREMLIRISCVNGPRISSMDLRPDLSNGSAFTEMRRCLIQRRKTERLFTTSSNDSDDNDDAYVDENENDENRLYRVGVDHGVHVASSNVIFVLAVANENTTTEIVIHREGGQQVGGFQSSPLTTIEIHPGVSVKFPVVIPRIPRAKDIGSVAQLAEEVVSLTKLRWETKRENSSGNSEVAKGFIRIPLNPLKEIIQGHPSFVSHMCEPPCQIQFSAEGKPINTTSSCDAITVPLGKAVEVGVEATVAAWVPPHIVSKCSLTLEFFCARTDGETATTFTGSGSSSSSVKDETTPREYVWCGKLKQDFRMDGPEQLKHSIRIAFVRPGTYSVSGCARIRHDSAPKKKKNNNINIEEVWLAPFAATLIAEKLGATSNATQ